MVQSRGRHFRVKWHAIDSRRRDRDLTLTDLAGRAGITRQALYNWSIGATQPAPSSLAAVARVLDCQVSDLVRRV